MYDSGALSVKYSSSGDAVTLYTDASLVRTLALQALLVEFKRRGLQVGLLFIDERVLLLVVWKRLG